MQDAGYEIRDAGCWMLDARCLILDTRYWILVAGYWSLASGAGIKVAYSASIQYLVSCIPYPETLKKFMNDKPLKQ